ncbi:MAG TPA: glycosyltransferase, partial [bacterium]
LSIIIVNYNVKDFLEQTLISVTKALQGIAAEITVVDNNSNDGSVAHVRHRFPEVAIIANRENLGFARACNQGLRAARGEFMLLLNPDTIVQEETCSRVLDFMRQRPDTGLVGCKILNPDGSLQLACRRSFPTPWVAFTKLSGLSHFFPKTRLFGRYNLTYLDPGQTHAVEAVSGSFMMIRRAVLENVGLLDESFFMYGEDLDWCYRIHQSGWKVHYFPGTQIIHFKGESSKRSEFDHLKMFYQAMSRFAKKHFHTRYLFMPYWVLWLAIWGRGSLAFLSKCLKYLAVPLTDLSLLLLSLVLSVFIRFENLDSLHRFTPVLVIYSIVWMAALNYFGSFGSHKFSLSKATLAVTAGFFGNAALTFFFKQYAFSRAVVLMAGCLSLLALPGWRLFVRILPRLGIGPFQGTLGKTLLARNTLIVGDVASGQRLIKKFNSQIDAGYNVLGVVSMNGTGSDRVEEGAPVLGAIDDLNDIIRNNKIQEVIFSTTDLSFDRILSVIAQSRRQRVNFKLAISSLEVVIGKASIDRIDDVPLLELDYKLQRWPNQLLKRSFDIFLSGLLILVTSPFYFLKRFLLRTSLQEKIVIGNLNRNIILYQFVGKNTRRNRLPYLWAVFKGDISFVGKEMTMLEPELEPRQDRRELALKPGLTGLVQVNQHRQLTTEDKEKYYLYYVRNYSILLDAEIILKALFKL